MPVASLFPWKALPRGLVSQRVLEDADCVDAVKGVPPPHAVFTEQRQMLLTQS